MLNVMHTIKIKNLESINNICLFLNTQFWIECSQHYIPLLVLDEIATGPHVNIHVENMWQNGYPPPISIKLTMNTRFQSVLVTWQQVVEANNLYLQNTKH